ncbi:hypothetical protein G7Y89_g6988 [Cudoniella acicularis]|uniref:Uncharacterized protein n=1 Tax=Cudoniella acicularis TaxID=354080 RepID=A0A8H4RJG0_9HELO|nr:hypothetical protein G7Y89_g6988 [Cudoniella acicularis]
MSTNNEKKRPTPLTRERKDSTSSLETLIKVPYTLSATKQLPTLGLRSLVYCLIEIVLEYITVILYGIVFYRYYSKQRLRKSIDIRDRARSDLYLA